MMMITLEGKFEIYFNLSDCLLYFTLTNGGGVGILGEDNVEVARMSGKIGTCLLGIEGVVVFFVEGLVALDGEIADVSYATNFVAYKGEVDVYVFAMNLELLVFGLFQFGLCHIDKQFFAFEDYALRGELREVVFAHELKERMEVRMKVFDA